MKICYFTLFIIAIVSISAYSTEANYIQNGDFENPNRNGGWAISTIPHWSEIKKEIETGKGTIYNSKWTTGQICELDANVNSVISQAVRLSRAVYTLVFTHASK